MNPDRRDRGMTMNAGLWRSLPTGIALVVALVGASLALSEDAPGRGGTSHSRPGADTTVRSTPTPSEHR